MKTLKRAKQRNTAIDELMYSVEEIQELINNTKAARIFDWEKNYPECVDGKFVTYSNKENARLFLDYVTEIKVICDKEGYYRTVAVLDNGLTVYVNLAG